MMAGGERGSFGARGPRGRGSFGARVFVWGRRGAVPKATVLLMFALVPSACTDPAARCPTGPLTVSLGQGQDTPAPLDAIHNLVVHRGSQGGQHAFIGVGASAVVGPLAIDVRVTSAATQALLGERTLTWSDPDQPQAAGARAAPFELPGLLVFLVRYPDPQEPLVVRAEIRDACDRVGSVEHATTPAP